MGTTCPSFSTLRMVCINYDAPYMEECSTIQMIAQCKVMKPQKRDSNAVAESESSSTGEVTHLFLGLGAAGAYLGDGSVSLVLSTPQLLAFVIQNIALRLQALLLQLSLLQRTLLLPQLLLLIPNLLCQPSADSACITCATGTSMTSTCRKMAMRRASSGMPVEGFVNACDAMLLAPWQQSLPVDSHARPDDGLFRHETKCSPHSPGRGP